MKYEIEKLLRQKKLYMIVTVLFLAVYVYLAFSGSYDTFSGYSLEYFWKNEDYRQQMMAQKTERVDEAWKEKTIESYKNYVDENRLTPEESEKRYADFKSQGFQMEYTVEEALADPYNIAYSLVILTDEAYQSFTMSEIYWMAFETYMPLAKNPKQYFHDYYAKSDSFYEEDMGMSYMDSMGYSKAQQEDYWKFIDTAYNDFTLTVGYCLGWDVLCSFMQFFPFTLGMVVIVILGNLFSQEQTDNMTPILRTTKNGRSKLLRKKLILAIMVSTILWLLFQVAALVAIGMSYTLQGGGCTAMCFLGVPSLYGLTWLDFYLIQCMFSYFGTIVFSLLVCCMSSLLKLRLSLPITMVFTLLTGVPLDRFFYADKAFGLLDKVRAITPAQLMASYPTLQVYHLEWEDVLNSFKTRLDDGLTHNRKITKLKLDTDPMAGFNHLAVFLRWMYEHDMLSDELLKEYPALPSLIEENKVDLRFIIKNIPVFANRLALVHFNDKGKDFAKSFYRFGDGGYPSCVDEYALEVLGEEKYNCKEYQNEAYLFVEYNEEYYQGLSKYIDEAYEKYNNDNKMSLLDELNRNIEGKKTLDEYIDAFKEVCSIPIDEDMILFETGVYDFTGEELFYFSFVRQFPNDEDEYYQLHLDILYEVSKDNLSYQQVTWDCDIDKNIFDYIKSSDEYKTCKDKKIYKIDVFFDET